MEYIIIIAAVFAVYLKSVSNGYVVDDGNCYVKLQEFKEHPFKNWHNLMYGAGLFKNTRLDHLFRIVLTCAIACMIMCNWGNIWIALLWAVHPINNQLTLWLNGRRYQVSLLLGLMCYKWVYLGFVVYPIALMIHPISAPIILITAILKTPIALLWVLPALLALPKLKNWTRGRFAIQNFQIYREFNRRKPILAIKCLAEYLRHGLFPTGFTMYHPEIWGIAELPGNKARCYALNASFWLCLALLSLISYIGWFIGGSCLVGLLIAFLGIIQWSGVYTNPTMLWAQRYTALSSIGFTMFTVGVAEYTYPTVVLPMVFVWYAVVTIKDMPMYRDFFSFFWHHNINQPNNLNSAWFGCHGFNGMASVAMKEKKGTDAKLYGANALAYSLSWCFRNRKGDIVHDFATQQLKGMKKPLEKGA